VNNDKTGTASEPSDIQILADVEADLAAVERLVRRQHPGFEHPTLAKVRALIERITTTKRSPS
jgi:hypothetical protein